MNPGEILRIVDSLHRDKNIDKEVVFQAIEAAFVSAVKRQFGDESAIEVQIDREDGSITTIVDGETLDQETQERIGRIGAQTAKQVIIQKIREAERDSLIEEYAEQIGQMVSGVVQRSDPSATTVQIANIEALLPRSEQIPGESHHPNERVRAVVCEVRPQGSRVKVVISRTRPQLVARLFEQEIPEIADGVIEVNAMSREPGYRSKVAVSSTDGRVDCVGACVGVRGNRIKNIVDELAGERIDIVRWSDDPEILIPNALQPAEVDQVLLCAMIGRAIVLVREDQLSLAIGRRGQNVRLASKLCGWDIEIMTAEELDEQIERAVLGFSELDGVNEECAQALVEQGYLSYDDLSVIEPDALMELGGLTAEQVDAIVAQAEERAEAAELAAAEERRRQREADRRQQEADAAAAAAAAAGESTETPADAGDAEETPAEETPADGATAEAETAAEPAAAGEAEAGTGEAEVAAGEAETVASEPEAAESPASEPDERPAAETETETEPEAARETASSEDAPST